MTVGPVLLRPGDAVRDAELGVRLTDTAQTDKIRLRYEQSLAQVLPLKDQLAKTDRLIDQVVYRLYGLTEEEIGVVEGRG